MFQQSIKIAIALGSHAKEDVLAKVVGDREGVLRITKMSQFASMLVAVSVTSSLAGSRSVVNDDPSKDGRNVVKKINEEYSQDPVPAPKPPVPDLVPAPVPSTPDPKPPVDPLFTEVDVE